MVVFNNEILKVTDFKKIVSIDENAISLEFKENKMHFYGEKLRLIFFSKEELQFKGKIKEIKINENI